MNRDVLKMLNPDGRTTQERINDELSKRHARYERRTEECRQAAMHSAMARRTRATGRRKESVRELVKA